MDTPPLLRGRFYNTLRVFRCPNFHQCVSCKKCQNYNPHLGACQACEINKHTICKHTDKQQATFRKIEEMFNKPFAHVDDVAPDTYEEQRRYEEESSLIQIEEDLKKAKIEAKDS